MKRFYLLFKGCISFSFPTYKAAHAAWYDHQQLVPGNVSGPRYHS